MKKLYSKYEKLHRTKYKVIIVIEENRSSMHNKYITLLIIHY